MPARSPACGAPKTLSHRIVYRYTCHTCKVHFSSSANLGDHHLAFHRPLNCTYLPNPPSSTRYATRQKLGSLEPILHCVETGCACPRFEFFSDGHSSEACIESGARQDLDGVAGSTLTGEELDDDFEIEPTEVKLVQKSGKEEHSMRKRFNKGRFGLKQKLRDEAAGRDLEFFRAYEAADRNIFGRERFEELEDRAEAGPDTKQGVRDEADVEENAVKPLSPEEERARLDSWKHEVGLKDLQKEKEKQDEELQNAIDSLIFDTIFELEERDRERKRESKARRENSRLHFEDMIEDMALEHEQRIAENERQDLRKTLGKKMTQALGRERDEDMVDEVAFGHLQDVAETLQEHSRRREGKKQERDRNRIKFEETVDNAALDHLQELEERGQEHSRRALGIRETRGLAAQHWEDVAEEGILDYFQEKGEAEREMERGALGRKQNRRLARMEAENDIEEVVADHFREVAGHTKECTRRRDGSRQTRSIARDSLDTEVKNAISSLPRRPGLRVGNSALSGTEKADAEKRSEVFLKRFQAQADIPSTAGSHFATQTAQEPARRAASPTNAYPVFCSPGKHKREDEEVLDQPDHSVEGSACVTESSRATRRRKRPKNSKQMEYDAMVDEMVKKFEASKRSGKNPNGSACVIRPGAFNDALVSISPEWRGKQTW
ncbi:hypothetical protein C7212DRAFT_366748 [Tuber magnatum]|uniref:C2H2-type domain-containing protein n=1 Tax=Tuber magnatum TaxID=42249 RepID=A0A317SEU7_9PEZI|nr:hypothetical protein C7212DRAFT_366748 [Tuber magnatum]